MKKTKKVVEIKPIGPFHARMVLDKLFGAIDEMSLVMVGYRHSELFHLMECIVRLASIAEDPKAKSAKEELSKLLKLYEKKYGWD
jgi:hypothetical protein